MGLHIVDNANPRNPINKGFLRIPLNEEVIIKGDILYANAYNELFAIDISNLDKISISKGIKLENFFINKKFNINDKNGLIIGKKIIPIYKPKVINPFPNEPKLDKILLSYNVNEVDVMSIKRFSIVEGYLYTLNNSFVHLFDLSDPKKPESLGRVETKQS